VHEIEIILGLLVAVAVLVTVSRRTAVPYPVLLVVGGLALALVPGLPALRLDPEIVFLLFLPPLLYWESLTAPLSEFRKNARPIFLLAVGLVLVTTVLVAVVAHALIHGLTWPAAYVLGAVLAPTDEVAVSEVANRLSIPRRVLSILEGESLVNDAISLVAYRMAVAAAVTGAFSLDSAALQFVLVGVGGVVIGLGVGWGIAWLRRFLDDPAVENTVSLLSPFAAYLPAETLHVSGVLAVVAIGLYLGRQGPRFVSSRTRLQARAMWGMISFVLNGLLFILTGLQLRFILHEGLVQPAGVIVGYIFVILLTLIAVRFAWVFAGVYVPRLFRKRARRKEPITPWQNLLLVGWTGVRGGLSLVTALAVPFTLSGARPFPGRPLIIWIAFFVILVTLLLQGLTLPWLIRRLHITDNDDSLERKETRARIIAARAALRRLDAAAKKGKASPASKPGHTVEGLTATMIEDLREHYQERIHRDAARVDGREGGVHEAATEVYQHLRRELVQAEREAVLKMFDRGEIDEEVLRHIQNDLDIEELRLSPQEE
jgi:CPA1 family monovalent cation:H+ antiporter